jgi:ectoine hydroxylase-related dioxygenase (phytanoyl-CoA dioxygenase family)
MWWHTNFRKGPDKHAAEWFHFDMDRVKWLKVFIYLTDVGADDGPHTYIAGSHRTGAMPRHLLKKGYARLTDDEVLDHFGRDALVEFCAPRGTVILEDTRGLHKGRHVTGSPRLVLQLQFSNSLFGATNAKVRLGALHDPALRRLVNDAPEIYRAFL